MNQQKDKIAAVRNAISLINTPDGVNRLNDISKESLTQDEWLESIKQSLEWMLENPTKRLGKMAVGFTLVCRNKINTYEDWLDVWLKCVKVCMELDKAKHDCNERFAGNKLNAIQQKDALLKLCIMAVGQRSMFNGKEFATANWFMTVMQKDLRDWLLDCKVIIENNVYADKKREILLLNTVSEESLRRLEVKRNVLAVKATFFHSAPWNEVDGYLFEQDEINAADIYFAINRINAYRGKDALNDSAINAPMIDLFGNTSFIIDEFAYVSKSFMNLINSSRSMGVSMVLTSQAIDDFKHRDLMREVREELGGKNVDSSSFHGVAIAVEVEQNKIRKQSTSWNKSQKEWWVKKSTSQLYAERANKILEKLAQLTTKNELAVIESLDTKKAKSEIGLFGSKKKYIESILQKASHQEIKKWMDVYMKYVSKDSVSAIESEVLSVQFGSKKIDKKAIASVL